MNRLVPEILGNVFLHALGDDYSNTIVPLTHVCRYWREVALGYPLLWCKPSSCHLEFLETALHRNKRVGLELDIDTQNVNQNIARPVYDRATSADLRRRILQAVQIKLAHVGDATSIRLHSRTTEFFRAALEALQTDAPFLESLDIQNAGWMTETDARNVLVVGRFPRLHRLALVSYHLHRVPGLCKQLTSLELCSPMSYCSDLVKFLIDAPLLENLKFRHMRMTICDEHECGDQRIQREGDSVARLPYLLAHLSFSQHVALHIHNDSDDLRGGQLFEAIDLMSRSLTANRTVQFLCAQVSFIDDVHCAFWPFVGANGFTPGAHDSSASSLHVYTPHIPYEFSCHPSVWYENLPLEHVKVLRVHQGTLKKSPIKDLRRYFQRMKQLEALDVIDEVAEYLLPQLATRKRSGQGDHPALFESVKRLKVHLRVTYRPSYLDHDVMIEGAATRIPLVVDALACFFTRRV